MTTVAAANRKLGGIDTREALALAVTLAALSIAVYWRAAWNGFALDDLIHVTGDERVRTLSGALRAFSEPIYPGDLYRPLVMLSYALTHAAFGSDPMAHHAVNIALHAANAVLVMWIFSWVLGVRVAGWAAVIWAVNPITTEAVANVSGRAELMAAFFGLSSLLVMRALLERGGRGEPLGGAVLAVWSALLFLCALLSKESGAVLPLLVLLYGWVRGEVGGSEPRGRRWVAVALLATLVAYVYLRAEALGAALPVREPREALDNPLLLMPAGARLAAAIELLGRYIRLILVPYPLSADYSYAHALPLRMTLELSVNLFLFAVMAAAAVIGLRRNPRAGFGALWFFASFAVTSNVFFPIGTIFAERLAYLPSAGVAAALAYWAGTLRRRGVFEVLLGAQALFYAAGTIAHVPVWRGNETLHSYQITVSPESAKTQLNYAIVLRNERRFEEARRHLDSALRIFPHLPAAAFAYATVEHAAGDDGKMEEWLRRTLELDPAFLPALRMIGALQFNRGDMVGAERYFRRMLDIAPRNFEARLGLLKIAVAKSEAAPARRMLNELNAEDPGNAELSKLRAVLDRIEHE